MNLDKFDLHSFGEEVAENLIKGKNLTVEELENIKNPFDELTEEWKWAGFLFVINGLIHELEGGI